MRYCATCRLRATADVTAQWRPLPQKQPETRQYQDMEVEVSIQNDVTKDVTD